MIGGCGHIEITAFTNGFASIERFNDSQFSCFFLYHPGDPENVFGSFFGRHFFPDLFISCTGSHHGFVDIRRIGIGHFTQFFFSGRIDRIKIFFTQRLLPFPIDKQIILFINAGGAFAFRGRGVGPTGVEFQSYSIAFSWS